MNNINYQVGNHTFFNKFQAADYAYSTGQTVKFNLYESSFDLANWLTEPSQTWDQLLDRRARQIEAKGLPIILHFSGGTDSYTIYKVFERNNIHIDILYFRTRSAAKHRAMYEPVVEFLNKGIYDPHCKIIIKNDFEGLDILSNTYYSENWIWDTSRRYTFAIQGGNQIEHDELCKTLGKDAISIIGLEKPRLHFDNQRVYSFQDDINFAKLMGSSDLDCFYLTPELPELHVKQSYMLKNYLKTKFGLAKNNSTVDLKQVNFQFNPARTDWNEYSAASGRFGDIASSQLQHARAQGSQLIIPESENYLDAVWHGLGDELFKSIKGTDTFKNYVTGMINVRKGNAGKYFHLTGNDLHSIPMIRSKYYELNF